MGNVLFFLGFPSQALALSNAAIAEARRLAHAPSLAQSFTFGTRLLSEYGDNAALADRADEFCALATDQGFAHWRAQAAIYRGWVKVTNGDVIEGMSLLRAGLTDCRATGNDAEISSYIPILARACEIAVQVEEALALLADALQIVERTGERRLAAELNRHKGQLLLRQGHSEAAEELYRKALSIAQEQGAKLWEFCAPPRASPGCAATRVATPRTATFWHRSTAGSPKASTRPI